MELKNRKEMDPQFQWDYTHMFESKETWEKEFERAKDLIADIQKVAGTLCESAESLKKGLDTIYGAFERIELVYLYAYLHKCGDNGDPEYQDMAARAIQLLVSIETVASFVQPEILAIPEETLKKYLEYDGLKTYRHMLDDIARGRAHTLDAEKERMLAMLGDAAQSPSDSFEMLESVDMTFQRSRTRTEMK
jgi:oligoendopeptidase F